ncbi:MAG: sugar ABC transporter substrate-binding protein [Chloroflexota bacterium]
MKKLSLLAMLLLALFLVACGGGAPEAPAPAEEPAAEESSEEMAEEEMEEEMAEEEDGDSGAGLSTDDLGGDGEVAEIRYINWDINQFPAYEECAVNFNAANPGINVTVENIGWDDYWTSLQTEMVGGGAADVFTNHLAKYPEFVAKGQILDVQPWADRDNVDVSIYLGELEQLWTRDGTRYGLPKDWDTVAVIYDKDALEAAGITEEELNSATWDPETGGTFGEIMAKLTLDENGNNAMSADFDASSITQHGYGADYPGSGAYGQTVFSMFAASTGWNFVDGLYATAYNYDDPRFIATMQWFQDSIASGTMISYEDVSSLGSSAAFAAGNTAMTTDGSWMIGFYSTIEDKNVGFARLPIGPEGRQSMFNGLADSIWSGTDNPEAAWEWVKYAASPDCLEVVGGYGVVFPSIEAGVNNALAVYGDRGLDVSAFTAQALEEGGTFLFPVTDNASEIADIMVETLDAIYLGQAEAADVLPAANDAVNATFGADAGSSGEAVEGAGLEEEDVDGEGEMMMTDVSGEIRYINWDINQFPAYEECAVNFMEIYPNITVEVENIGWDDYWTSLQTEMVAGGAADVFTNHLAKYPEFVEKGQIIDVQPWADRDEVDVSIYLGELEQLWTRDGTRYGLPKDWDTVAVIYDKDALEAAGVTEEELNNATWDPETGGTFGEIMAKLTVDENGNNAMSADFDASAIAQHGYGADYPGSGAYGQTVFSMFAASTGWRFVDGLYATEYNYDDPRFAATMQWFQDNIAAGTMISYEDVSSLGSSAAFAAGNTAMTTDGSWMIGFYSTIENKNVGFARLPIGPEGRQSMFNGLADSIWTGTEHPEAAWEWVKYAASPACLEVVGTYGVVFPSVAGGVENALGVYADRGIDVSAFTLQATEPGGTFLFPVTDNASGVADIMVETLDAIYLGQAPAADVLSDANAAVNDLFK